MVYQFRLASGLVPRSVAISSSSQNLSDKRKSRRYSARTPTQTKRADLCRKHKSALEHQPSLERMKLMESHGSANARVDIPHVTRTSRTNTIMNALRQRAQAVLNDTSIDSESRAIIRYALETHDPWLARLVRRAEAGEEVAESLREFDTNEDDPGDEKIAALAELICRRGDEAAIKSAALVVLMSALENAAHPRALANTAKHFAFTRCSELNFCGMVEAQIPVFESEILRE